MTTLDRTKNNPWVLKTPPGTAEYTMHVEAKDGLPVLVCTVGTTVLYYDARCIDDLYTMLKEAGDWVELGGADEQKPAKEGTVEAWGRSPSNPVHGWYGVSASHAAKPPPDCGCILGVLDAEFGGQVPLFRCYEKVVAGDEGWEE
jgi:hypothetical protein